MELAIGLIPIFAFSLGLLTSLATFYLWLSNSVRKRYAAERDFEHIKRNQEAVTQLLGQLDDDIKDLRTELIRYMEKSK